MDLADFERLDSDQLTGELDFERPYIRVGHTQIEPRLSVRVRAGQREGQFKPAVLQYRKDLALSFIPYVIE